MVGLPYPLGIDEPIPEKSGFNARKMESRKEHLPNHLDLVYLWQRPQKSGIFPFPDEFQEPDRDERKQRRHFLTSPTRYRISAAAVTYGFVNMISEAPSAHLVECDDRKYLTGRIPHINGSSKLHHFMRNSKTNVRRMLHGNMVGN